MGGPNKDLWIGVCSKAGALLGAGVLGDSLGTLTDGVLGQLTRQKKTDSSLDLSACDGGAAVVVCQTGGFSSDALKDVIHKGVHDGHGFAGDTSVGMYLLHHLVDVDAVAFPPPPPALLVPSTLGLCLRGGLLGSLTSGFGCHLSRDSKCKRKTAVQSFKTLLYQPLCKFRTERPADCSSCESATMIGEAGQRPQNLGAPIGCSAQAVRSAWVIYKGCSAVFGYISLVLYSCICEAKTVRI